MSQERRKEKPAGQEKELRTKTLGRRVRTSILAERKGGQKALLTENSKRKKEKKGTKKGGIGREQNNWGSRKKKEVSGRDKERERAGQGKERKPRRAIKETRV